jgi:ActR/RegA family two-component response regulator/anti-sigma regulatory factor (Ser/Thr protein kinase)
VPVDDRAHSPVTQPAESNDPRRELAGVLHDVSNALTVLLGWIAEARAPGASPESIAYALRIAEQRARTARDLARRAIGVDTPLRQEEDAIDVIAADTLAALAVVAQQANVALRLEGSTGVRVHAGSDASHVLTNLVLNALAHAPAGTEVRVTLEGTPLGVHVDVEDDGPGVPPARHRTIFEGDTTRPGGAGVGLPHARALSRAGGGDLELIPTPAGAFFRLTWPRVGVMPSAPPTAARARTLEGKRVLVVEDDADVTMLLETSLGARGASVTLARDTEELRRALVLGVYDAALVDLSPIANDVAGALTAVCAGSPNVTIVFITGSADTIPTALPSLHQGTVRVVRKPFEVAEVVRALVLSPQPAPKSP